MTEKEIDEWIIKNFAYVSEAQLKLVGLWTTEYHEDKTNTKWAHRPPNYSRSGMIEAEGGGMADIKGLGQPPGKKLEWTLGKLKKSGRSCAKRKRIILSWFRE